MWWGRPRPETALKRLFQEDRPPAGAVREALPGGAALFAAGDPAEHLYFLRSGRLAAVRGIGRPEQMVLGVIKPGEPVGEMSLIAGTPHTATVVALRDSVVDRLPRAAFFARARKDPEVLAELAQLMIRRAREVEQHGTPASGSGEPTVFGFAALSRRERARDLAERVAKLARESGARVVVVSGAEIEGQPPGWVASLEQKHDLVLLSAEADEGDWAAVVGRQVDRLFLIGTSDAMPPERAPMFATDALQRHRLVDLILQHPAQHGPSSGAQAWLDATRATRVFHLREGDAEDHRRLARTVTATSVGIVLSGGGAKAYAHIGAVRALRAAGAPIDYACGASMGAVVAAGVAMGWDDEELDARVRRAFVDTNPLGDAALPFVALSRGEEVKRRLEEHFGDVEFADLPLPFFCVSSNLTSGAYQVHATGRVRWALRASVSLPGVLPPVVENGQVLVDGAVMQSLPVEVMRAWHRGPTVAVDVSRTRGMSPAELKTPRPLWKWFATGEWRKGPPIISVLIRSATVSSTRDLLAARAMADLVVTPEPDGVEIRDWKAYAPAVAEGERAMKAALASLTRPVPQLRHARTVDVLPSAAELMAEPESEAGAGAEPGTALLSAAQPR